MPEIARPGVPLARLFRRFRMLCLDEGADWELYLAGGAEWLTTPAGSRLRELPG